MKRYTFLESEMRASRNKQTNSENSTQSLPSWRMVYLKLQDLLPSSQSIYNLLLILHLFMVHLFFSLLPYLLCIVSLSFQLFFPLVQFICISAAVKTSTGLPRLRIYTFKTHFLQLLSLFFAAGAIPPFSAPPTSSIIGRNSPFQYWKLLSNQIGD